ncbi:MAG TPA: hypothetical protein VN836_12855 [Verrucomicrobiae bacterium]|nr:hypothetical protein [Verrucomicrobiae bacterium]
MDDNGKISSASPVRAIGDGPFCYQHKPALRKIRESFDAEKTVPSAILTYGALTEIASDMQTEIFTTTHGWIAQKSGLSPRTVQARLAGLVEIGLIEISTPILKAPSTYRLLPVPQSLPDDKQPLRDVRQRTKKTSLPSLEESKKNHSKKIPPESWKLLKDERDLQHRIESEQKKAKPDSYLVVSLRAEQLRLQEALKNSAPAKFRRQAAKVLEEGARKAHTDAW